MNIKTLTPHFMNELPKIMFIDSLAYGNAPTVDFIMVSLRAITIIYHVRYCCSRLLNHIISAKGNI